MTRRITIGEGFHARAAHTSIEQTGDTLEHTFDDAELGRAPAAAIATAIGTGIRAIAEPAAGGRRKEFNATGYLAQNITARLIGDEWVIVPPPGRLERDPKLVERLRELVPAIDQPLAVPAVQKAIEASPAVVIRKGRATTR